MNLEPEIEGLEASRLLDSIYYGGEHEKAYRLHEETFRSNPNYFDDVRYIREIIDDHFFGNPQYFIEAKDPDARAKLVENTAIADLLT